eukprot:scaffold11.g3839.t1
MPPSASGRTSSSSNRSDAAGGERHSEEQSGRLQQQQGPAPQSHNKAKGRVKKQWAKLKRLFGGGKKDGSRAAAAGAVAKPRAKRARRSGVRPGTQQAQAAQQTQLEALVGTVSAEAAALQRQLTELSIGTVPAACDGASLAGGAAGPAGSAVAGAPAAAAGVHQAAQQLAGITRRLEELTLCLRSMQAEVEPAPSSQEAAAAAAGDGDGTDAGLTYVAFDTNCWMHNLGCIRHWWRCLLAAHAAAAPGSPAACVRLLLPLEVVRELDGLKRCFLRRVWAQSAVKLLLEMQGHPLLRGQREDELLARGRARRNDDGILDCLLLFRARGAQVEMVSGDLALRVRVRNEGLACYPHSDCLPRLEALLAGKAWHGGARHDGTRHDSARRGGPAAAAARGIGAVPLLVPLVPLFPLPSASSSAASCDSSTASAGCESGDDEGELPPGFGAPSPLATKHGNVPAWMFQRR